MPEPVVVDREGAIVWVRLNRPAVFNAFDEEMVVFFAERIAALAADEHVRAVVLTGEGKAFCTGADLRWALALPGGPAEAVRRLIGPFHRAVLDLRRMSKPVVAAVNGAAAGGGFSLALACDLRLLARSAVLRQSYTSHGLTLDGGGSFSLPRLVGLARALEIAAFDPPITSEQALTWGLATKVVEDDSLREDARAVARSLAGRSLHSFGWTKQLLAESFQSSLREQLDREQAAMLACAAHPEGREGVRSFVEKRKPAFGPGS